MLLLWQRFIVYELNLQIYMKIYDCFMFFDEEMILDLRLNILSKYVDKFVITEATYMHSGKPKKLIFDINKFSKFKDKIIYQVIDKQPANIIPVNKSDDESTKEKKLIDNSNKREHFQREQSKKFLDKLDPDDLILINDIDEIPNLESINLNKINKKLILFKQKMFYFKFNLIYKNKYWWGSRACRKKNFLSPQWLRDVKKKKYPIWRLDIIFSTMKYNSIHYVENGGWHFTNIKSPEALEKKLLNYLHHYEYEQSGLNLKNIEDMIVNKKIIYDHSVDQRGDKFSAEKKLDKADLSEMPSYLSENYDKYIEWFDD